MNTILVAPKQKTLSEVANEQENDGHFVGNSDPFEMALAEFPTSDDATISVNRVQLNNSLAFLFSYHPDEYSISQLQTKLRDEYGGGKFRIRGVAGKKLRINQIIHIEALVKKPDALAIVPTQNVGQNQNDIIFALMQTMNQGFQELGKLIVQSSQHNAPVYDPQEAEDRFMARMLQMKSLFGESAPKQDAPVELFLKGLEFGKEIMGSAGESTTMDIVKEAIKTLGPALAGAMLIDKQKMIPSPQAGAPLIPRTRPSHARADAIPSPVVVPYQPFGQVSPPYMGAPPLAQTQPIAHDSVNDDTNETEKMRALIKKYVGDLCIAASANEDVTPYAQKVILDLGEDTIGDYLEEGNLIKELGNYEPQIYHHVEWFTLLSAKLEELIFDDVPLVSPAQSVENANEQASEQ